MWLDTYRYLLTTPLDFGGLPNPTQPQPQPQSQLLRGGRDHLYLARMAYESASASARMKVIIKFNSNSSFLLRDVEKKIWRDR